MYNACFSELPKVPILIPFQIPANCFIELNHYLPKMITCTNNHILSDINMKEALAYLVRCNY